MFLLSRAIVVFDLNFYIPIADVTKAMDTAHRQNAVLNERLPFRRYDWSSATYDQFNHAQELEHEKNNLNFKCIPSRKDAPYHIPPEEPYAPLTVNEIINGEQDTPLLSSRFPGLSVALRSSD